MQPPQSLPEGDTIVSPSEHTKDPHFESRPAGESDLEKSASVSSDVQAGVQNIEAAASVWSKWHLVAAYGL